MRIAYLITLMNGFGGAQVHVRDLTFWLKERGHEPIVLTGSLGSASDALAAEGIRVELIPDLVRSIRPMREMKAVAQVRAALKAIKPDILSCHSSKAGIVGRIAARLERVPVIFTSHGWAFTPGVPTAQRYAYMVAEKLAGPLSDHIVTVSERGRRQALALRIAPAQRITTIHNGMPVVAAPPRPRGNPVPKLVMIARFADPKDHATLLAALGTLKSLPWELNLVGGGDSGVYEKQSEDLGIRSRVIFHGERMDTIELLAEMDLFVLLSRHEGFPRSILEAMRASLPVLASDVGGIPESVLDGTTGLLVPALDVAATASALKELILNEAKRVRFGLAGRQRFMEDFTFEHLAAPTFKLYQDVISRHAKTSHD